MNCKPGDLAIVVGGPLAVGGARVGGRLPPYVAHGLAAHVLKLCIGRVVRVMHLTETAAWAIEEPIVLQGPINGTLPDGQPFVIPQGAVVDAFADRYLRPLPGLDEDDELLTERPRDEVPA